MIFAAIGIITIIAIMGIIIIFNKIVRLGNMVQESWSGISVQLKRRHDLIPNLVSTVQGYSKHEKSVFENVAKMRSAAMGATSVDAKSQAEAGLSGALKSLFAVAENYPELKANQGFLDLQKNLGEVEDQIQLARRYYNAVVRDYNTTINIFPNNLVANMINSRPKNFFELASTVEGETPKVSF